MGCARARHSRLPGHGLLGALILWTPCDREQRSAELPVAVKAMAYDGPLVVVAGNNGGALAVEARKNDGWHAVKVGMDGGALICSLPLARPRGAVDLAHGSRRFPSRPPSRRLPPPLARARRLEEDGRDGDFAGSVAASLAPAAAAARSATPTR